MKATLRHHPGHKKLFNTLGAQTRQIRDFRQIAIFCGEGLGIKILLNGRFYHFLRPIS